MKMDFDRRQFLGMSAGAFSMALLPRGLPAATATAAATSDSSVPAAPVARIDVAYDTYFGETLSDPYRWMENDKDPEWLSFLKGQNAHTRAVLDALPARLELLKRIQELSGETAATSRVQRAGGMTFFSQRPLGADNYKLFVRQGFTPLFDVPVKIENPEEPLGTHVFTAMEFQNEGAAIRWTVVSIPEEFPRMSEGATKEREAPAKQTALSVPLPDKANAALDRVEIPRDTVERISELLTPASSLIISDNGFSHETGKDTDFIVLTH